MKFLILISLIVILLSIFKLKNKIENFTDNKKPKKIAFLFLIYDKINYENLWYQFFKNIDRQFYNIYIHYKINNKLQYFEENKLSSDKIINTAWGSFSLVQAQNILLKEALKDESNYKMIFISGTTIPIKNFKEIYDINIKDNNSHFTLFKNQLKVSRCKNLYENIGRENVLKSYQWCILNRDHSKFLSDNEQKYQVWNTYDSNLEFEECVPDEHYYISYLLLNKKNNLEKHYFDDFGTYVDWFNGDPFEFTNISRKELFTLVNSDYMFCRKILENSISVPLQNFLQNYFNKYNKNKFTYIYIPNVFTLYFEELGNEINQLWGRNDIELFDLVNKSKFKNKSYLEFYRVPPENVNNFPKNNFCVVINPIRRLILTYINFDIKNKFENFEESKFEEFVNKINTEIIEKDLNFLYQHKYLVKKNKLFVDNILQIEDDTRMNRFFNNKFNVNVNINISKVNMLYDKLNNEIKEKIYKLYKKDFDYLNYKFRKL